MTAYIASAAGAVFLTVVVGMIIPDGKMAKSITFVLKIVCILVLLSPLINIFSIDIGAETGTIIDYDGLSDILSSNQSAQLEKLIFEQFGVGCECSVYIDYDGQSLNQTGVLISADDVESSLIEEIVSYLRELGYININVNEKIY